MQTTTIYSDLLSRYSGESGRTHADLSRPLTPAEREAYRQLGEKVLGLWQDAEGPLVADMGTHLSTEICYIKVAVELGQHPEGGLTADIFAMQPDALHLVRNVPGVSFDAGTATFDPTAAHGELPVGKLAELRLIHAALRHAVVMPTLPR